MIVGITGGIASGKSVCTNQFAKIYGIHIIDADIVARQLVEPGREAWKAIVTYFGDAILLPNKTLNRSVLREYIFSDPKARLALNTIIHPLIHQELGKLLQYQKQSAIGLYTILSAPLLLENKLDSYCDLIISVDVPISIQITRGGKRDQCGGNHIREIINIQIPRLKRIKRSNFIIDNSETLSHTFMQIDKLHLKLKKFNLHKV